MTIRNVSHVAIGVRDMDRSLRFYTEIVGLHVSLDTIEELPIAGGTVKRRAVYLREVEGPDEPFVVLDEQLTRPKAGGAKPLFDVGFHHFGFWVDDVDAVADRARAADVPIVAGPVDADTLAYGEAPGRVVRTLLVRDPDGNVVQFDQRTP
jgi:catechol 2,3-dioxygenase-like lactoylglutathione lyase family enzyme